MPVELSPYCVEESQNLFDLARRFRRLDLIGIKHNDDQLVSSSVTSTVKSDRLR